MEGIHTTFYEHKYTIRPSKYTGGYAATVHSSRLSSVSPEAGTIPWLHCLVVTFGDKGLWALQLLFANSTLWDVAVLCRLMSVEARWKIMRRGQYGVPSLDERMKSLDATD